MRNREELYKLLRSHRGEDTENYTESDAATECDILAAYDALIKERVDELDKQIIGEYTTKEIDVTWDAYAFVSIKGDGEFRFMAEACVVVSDKEYWGVQAEDPVEHPNLVKIDNESTRIPWTPALNIRGVDKFRLRIIGDGKMERIGIATSRLTI